MRGYFMNKEERKAYDKAYRQANKERLCAQKSAYIKANKERIRIRRKAYYEANQDKYKAWRNANKEKILAYMKAYNKANPEKCIRASHKRRALINKCHGSLSIGIAEKILTLQKFKCAVCKKSVKEKYHVDHIYPLSKGGSNTDDNIQILCPSCNMSKGSKHPQDFMMSKGFIF